MRINLGAELNFFDLVGVLVFFRFFLPLRQLVTILSEIDQAAYWRDGVRRHLDEVDPGCAGQRYRLAQRHDPVLLAVGSDNADLTSTYFPINPDEWTGRRRRT